MSTRLYVDDVDVSDHVVLNSFSADWDVVEVDTATFTLLPMPPAVWKLQIRFGRATPGTRRWLRSHHHFTGNRHRGTSKWERRYAHR